MSIEAVVEGINKKYGKDVLKRASDKAFQVERISSGVFGFDVITDGGLPRGRSVELYGEEGVGKSFLALKAIVEAQKQGLHCAYADLEHQITEDWLKKVGVNLKKIYIYRPSDAEQGIDIVNEMLLSDEFGVIVIDSIAALLPREETEKSLAAGSTAIQARLMSKGLRKLTTSNGKTLVIFINQIREKIGVIWGSPNTTSGGRAMKFYASQRIELKRGEAITEEATVIGSDLKEKTVEKRIGQVVRVNMVKEKTNVPHRTCHFTLMFDGSVDEVADLISWGMWAGIIERKGAWYMVGEEKFHGQDNLVSYCRNNPEFVKMIKDTVMARYTG